MNNRTLVLAAFCLLSPVGLHSNRSHGDEPCRIEVVDAQSGWPVPLVELTTTHSTRFVTDNAGVIALDDQSLMNREVWFHVIGHGYEVKQDGFGFRGVRLTARPGETLRVSVDRVYPAKRIGRLTGIGLYHESQKLGQMLDHQDGPVVGCDSIQGVSHQGVMHWMWGDTTLARYPLGVFHMSGATTKSAQLPIEPPLVPAYQFLLDAGQPRGLAVMPGEGPTWLTQVASLPDATGKPRLVATYRKIKAPLSVYEIGLCRWDDEQQRFLQYTRRWEAKEQTPAPEQLAEGHAAFWIDESGQRWLLFGNPFPHVRLPATYEAWDDPRTWERLKPQETLSAATTGERILPHSGSIAWSPHRQRWVTVFTQKFGQPSAFGSVWYAEADQPTGPWGPAVQIMSHDNYTFYNPRIHAESLNESPVLLFEGTYSAEFANHPTRTARYDYNQILYRLDLNDPQLASAQNK